MKFVVRLVLSLIIAVALASCEKEDSDVVVNVYYGEKENSSISGNNVTINMNGDYSHWYYFSFESQSIVKLSVEADEPENWDMAFHRFDVKTNSASAVRIVGAKSLADVLSIPTDGYQTNCLDTTIVVDLSKAIATTYGEGTLPATLNPGITSYVNCDMSNFPPTYSMPDAAYILRLSGGKTAALLFTDYKRDGKTANISFSYILTE